VALAYGSGVVVAAIAGRVPSSIHLLAGARDAAVLIRLGWRVSLANALQALNYRLDVVIMNLVSTVSAVGLYSVAVSLGSLLWYVPSAAGTVLLSQVGTMGRQRGAVHTASVSRVVLVLTLGAAGIAALVGAPAIHLLFGAEFDSSYGVLLLLLPGVVAMSLPKVLNSYLVVMGHPGVSVRASAVAVVATVALDLLLIPRWGPAGAAVASTAAYVLAAAVFALGFRRVSALGLHDLVPTLRDVKRLLPKPMNRS
jgi:O-antigen/teichoic acid export membrane protein